MSLKSELCPVTLLSTLQGRVTCSPSAAVWSGGSLTNFWTTETMETGGRVTRRVARPLIIIMVTWSSLEYGVSQ